MPPYFSRNCLPYLIAILFSVYDRVNICKHKTKFCHAALVVYGLAYWPLVPKVASSNPVGVGFFKGKKNIKNSVYQLE
jgi:hypothetical protein